MNIADIETSVVTKLSADITDVKVEAFPDNPEKYELNHPSGAILVRYNGDDYSDPDAPTAIIQNRTTNIQIILLMRNLRTHTGIYPKLDAIKASLKGHFVDSKYGPLFPREVSFLAFENGIWQWSMDFGFSGRELNQ